MAKDKPCRVLVTGTGFLGRGIIRSIADKHADWSITALDINDPPIEITGHLDKFFKADITDVEAVKRAFVKEYAPDVVLHTAGIVPSRRLRYSKSNLQWEKVKKIIYGGTTNVFNAALESGCKRFVYTSSVTAIIDDLEHDYFHMAEDSTPTGLATLHYGRAKGMTEAFLLAPDHVEKGMKVCVLRPCTILGPEDTQVINLLYDLIPKGETYFVIGDGNNVYDWMYIDNAVDAHVLAVENLLSTGTAAGHAIFITNHEPSYFWDFLAFVWAQFDHYPAFKIFVPAWLALIVAFLLEWITYVTGAPSTIDTGSVKDGIRTQFANNDKAIELLGYKPKIGLSEGVRISCESFKKQQAAKKRS